VLWSAWLNILKDYTFPNGFKVMHVFPESDARGCVTCPLGHYVNGVVIIAYSISKNEWVTARMHARSLAFISGHSWHTGMYLSEYSDALMQASEMVGRLT
jgi:hypothetical protein